LVVKGVSLKIEDRNENKYNFHKIVIFFFYEIHEIELYMRLT